MSKYIAIHEYFPPEIRKYEQDRAAELENFEAFGALKENTSDYTVPVDVALSDAYPLDAMIAGFLKKEEYPSGDSFNKVLKSYLQAPDLIVSFENIDFLILKPSLDHIVEFVNSHNEKARKQTLIKIMKTLMPLFVRCTLAEAGSQSYSEFYTCVMGILDHHPIVYAMEIMIAGHVMTNSLSNVGTMTRLIRYTVELMHKIYKDDDFRDLIIPYVSARICEMMFVSFQFMFPLEGEVAYAGQRLYALQTSIECVLKIALMYPPALRTVPLNSFIKWLMRWPNGYSECYPSFEYVCEAACQVEPSVAAANINALVNSFSLLSYLDRKSVPAHEEQMVLATLIKLGHENRYASRAIAQSLINMSKYSLFKPVFEKFKQLLKQSNQLAILLYTEISAYNFSKDFVVFEHTHKLASLPERVDSLQKPFLYQLQFLSKPDQGAMPGIFDVVRVLDGVLMLNPVELAVIVLQKSFLTFITEYLTKLMEKGVAILDIRLAFPFAHLATSYLELITTMRTPKDTAAVGINVEFILSLYRNILFCAPPIDYTKQAVSVISSDIFLERRRFARLVKGYCPRFLSVAFMKAEHRHVSLMMPAVMLLCDILNLEPFTADLVKDIMPFFRQNLKFLLASSSSYVFNAVDSIICRLYQNVSPGFLDRLLTEINNIFRDSFQASEEDANKANLCIRLLILMSHVTAIPVAKLALLTDEGIDAFLESIFLTFTLKTAMANEMMTIAASHCLLHLLSPSITPSTRFDKEMRAYTESIGPVMLNKAINVICDFLNMRKPPPERAAKAVMRLLSFICELPTVIAILINKKHFTLTIDDLIAASLWESDDFVAWSLEFYLTLAKADAELAKRIMGFKSEKKITEYCDEELFEVYAELIQTLESDIHFRESGFDFAAVQQRFNQRREKYNDRKSRYWKSVVPTGYSNSYLETTQEIPGLFQDIRVVPLKTC